LLGTRIVQGHQGNSRVFHCRLFSSCSFSVRIYKFRVFAKPEPIGMVIVTLQIQSTCKTLTYLHVRFSSFTQTADLPVKTNTSVSLCTTNYRWNALTSGK
jgi:hypothetical protein